MPRDLKTLEDTLWEHFEAAVKRHQAYVDNGDNSYASSSHPTNHAIENRKGIAEIAQAIVAVKRERRVEKFLDDQQKFEDEIEQGIRRDVSVVKKLKIKEP